MPWPADCGWPASRLTRVPPGRSWMPGWRRANRRAPPSCLGGGGPLGDEGVDQARAAGRPASIRRIAAGADTRGVTLRLPRLVWAAWAVAVAIFVALGFGVWHYLAGPASA